MYAHFLFEAFDINNNGSVSFEVTFLKKSLLALLLIIYTFFYVKFIYLSTQFTNSHSDYFCAIRGHRHHAACSLLVTVYTLHVPWWLHCFVCSWIYFFRLYFDSKIVERKPSFTMKKVDTRIKMQIKEEQSIKIKPHLFTLNKIS